MTHLKYTQSTKTEDRTHYIITCGSIVVGRATRTQGYHRVSLTLRTRKGNLIEKEYESFGIMQRAARKLYRR